MHSAVLEMREEAEYWVSEPRDPRKIRATVVIPSFGAEATLMRAARSALDQTLRDIELVIVDDASPDGSWRLIDGLMRADSRVRAVRHKWNCGKSVAMNRVIGLARGDWLAVLDADDWYHPERLDTLVDLAETQGAEMAADNQFFYDAKADCLVGTAWPSGASSWRLGFDDFLAGSDAYQNFNLGMLKPVIRLDFMRRLGLGYEETARVGEDFFHLLQFYLAGGQAVISDNPLYYYTQPFGSLSRQWSHSERTRYDFQNAYEINRRYLGKAAATMTSAQRRRLHARHSRLKVLENYFRAKDAVMARDWTGAAAIVLRNPGSLALLARRLRAKLLPVPEAGAIPGIALRARRRDRGDGNAR